MLEFVHFLERLKRELRHSYISDGRQEDVAQHSWRMAVMAMVLQPEEKVDVSKCVRMALVHDLPEAISGDVFALDAGAKKGKPEREERAMREICSKIADGEISGELFGLWSEYEAAKTPEARFVKLLDKFEVLIQHNEAPFETWAEVEKETHYGMAAMHSMKYGLLKKFADEIDSETLKKLEKSGHGAKKLSPENYEKFFGAK